MSYATTEDLTAYVADDPTVELPGDPTDLLQRAQRDLDRYLGWPAPLTDTPRVLAVTAYQAAALRRATCAQAAYRAGREDEIRFPEDGVAGLGGAIQFNGRRPSRIAPVAEEELAGAGLMRRTLTAAPSP